MTRHARAEERRRRLVADTVVLESMTLAIVGTAIRVPANGILVNAAYVSALLRVGGPARRAAAPANVVGRRQTCLLSGSRVFIDFLRQWMPPAARSDGG